MRKLHFFLLITLLVGGLIGTARISTAVEWKYFTSDGEGNPMYYDPGTIKNRTFNVVSVWVKYKTGYTFKMRDYGYSVSLFKVDCLKGKLASEIIVDFDNAGSFLGSVSSSGDPWFPVSPDSLYTRLFKTVCPPSFP